MASSKLHPSMGSSKAAEGFHSKVGAAQHPKLLREAEESVTLTPSAFLKEMALTTQQRLASTREVKQPQVLQLLDMSETSHQKFSAVDLEQSLFQPFPTEVVFQNYVPCQVYQVPLVLRNNDKVPRLVKVVLESSPYFKLLSCPEESHKVAPGMLATFHILFTPEEKKDYSHQLTCITEREKFIVPIRAIGPRALLDFPDHLSFSSCPVKYSSQKTLLVRNVGTREARYCISTRSPFSVDPSVGTLGTGDTMQVTVEFHPLKTGHHSTSLVVHYDTGEDVHTSLHGTAVDVNIRLDRNSLAVEKTYLTLSNHRSVVIHNQSDIIAHFQWKAFVTEEEEEQHKLRLCDWLQREEEDEAELLKVCVVDPLLRDRLVLLSRTFQSHRAKVQGDSLLFSDDFFTIEPVEGDVWPHSSAEIQVIFKPQEARVYQQTIYCDISGRETRLPLRVTGEGVGPQLCFSFDQLDIGKVFVGSAHSYEVILFNKGAVHALFSLIPPATALGSCFSFLPDEGVILPQELQAIQVSFSSSLLGQFTEEFGFRVQGCPEPVTLTIRGCVIAPTFHFNVPSLLFGDVSFGFPHTLSCRLSNTSLVPMTFTLRIPGDGSGKPSVTSLVQMADKSRGTWRRRTPTHGRPTEFTIKPQRGTIRSQGFLDIQVTLCSNTLKQYELALVVDLDGIGKEVLALPIIARCVVPELRVLNPTMTFGRCFLKHPYQQMLTLVNNSDLPGCYRLLPQVCLCSSPMPCGIIQPCSSVQVPVTLATQKLGEQDTVAHVAVFGMEGDPLKIRLVSFGEGPVVYVHPNELNFGNIQVLQDVSQTLHLSNQAVIPASFWAEMAGRCSRWRIEPNKGVIPPEAEVSLAIIANLDDTESFQDEVKVFIENSHTSVIPVQALGIGTTIVTDKPFAPKLSLGPHFSAPKGRASSPKPSPASPVFKLRPLIMDLLPGKTTEMMLEGSCNTPQVVRERLLCHSIVGNKGGKVKIMQVDVSCEFVAPVLQISSTDITFRVEKHPSDVLTLQYKPLSLKNISSLPLSVVLVLEQPFFICSADQQPFPADVQPMKLEVGEELHLSISFNPAYEEDLNIRVVEKALKIQFLEHPHQEQVTLRGEVYFPNLQIPTTTLDFGCILNDTEEERCVEMTNCSPLPVLYHWSFLTDSHSSSMRFSPPAPKFFLEFQALKEEGTWSELPGPAGSRDGGAEESAEALGEVEDPGQEPADADASLEAKVEGPAEVEGEVRIKQLMQFMETEPLALGVEEVFDILPLYGELQPGQSQQVTFTFFGHTNIVARVLALCRVEGGPTYQVLLTGEASLINYLLDIREIDCGVQLFHEVLEAELTLRNSGKVGFTYVVLSPPGPAPADTALPGVPLVLPSSGYLGPGKEQVLRVYYLPGVPGVFCRTFQIQVGHLEPEEISLKGEGSFPRICLDLPRNIQGNEKYEKVLLEAKQKMEKDRQRDAADAPGEAVATGPPVDSSDPMLDTLLQMEMEQMLMEEHALEQQKVLASGPLEDTAFDLPARRRLLKAQLPEYLLDFGHVVLGNTHSHMVKVTNTGSFPVSFCADGRVLGDTGLSVELGRVRNLPQGETETFQVRFDPQRANQLLGEVDVLLPIKVTGGPTFHVRLRAQVAEPSLCLSRNRLEFSTVQCGQCLEETVQLWNQLQVPCKWVITMNEAVKKVDKHLPAVVRQKLLQELKAKPGVFSAVPSAGTLAPRQKCQLRVRFSPTEERSYRNELKINICQSRQQLQLQVLGRGVEPQLEFNPPVLELGPLLPLGRWAEGTVVVKNPCEFPIELYSLEFDQQYLAEEEMLRMLKDYDGHNTLLLPPRAPGEKLPPEVLEYCRDQKKLQDEQTKSRPEGSTGQESAASEDVQSQSDQGGKHSAGVIHTTSSHTSIIPSSTHEESQSSKVDSKSELGEDEEGGAERRHGTAEPQPSTTSSKENTGEVEESPVCRAIARHLSKVLSAEGHAAQIQRGIVIIVHGAPRTGKTSAAVALSKRYGAACLSIDAVVREAISDRSSPAGLRARELCIKAAMEQSHKDTEEPGQAAEVSLSQQLGAEAKPSPSMSQSSSAEKGSQQSSSSRSRVSRRRSEARMLLAHKQHSTEPRSSQDSSGSYVISSTPCVPAQRWQSVSSTEGELSFLSCVLPKDLLLSILSKRLQQDDCYQGVVFDGLETLFARNPASALLCLLKAIKDRPHIYFVNLSQDYAALKAKEAAAKEQQEREQEEAARRAKAQLWEVDEEEYDALPEEKKAELNDDIRRAQRERKQREMERKARELEEKQQQELQRLKEEEMKKKGKKGKKEVGKDKDSASGKRSHPGGKQNTNTSTSNTVSTSNRSDVTEGAEKKGHKKECPESAGSGKEAKKHSKVPPTDPCPPVPAQPSEREQDETKTVALSDSEKNLALRFQICEALQKDIAHILASWDRAQGILLSLPTQEEVKQPEDNRQRVSSHKRRKDKEKEQLEKQKAPEEAQSAEGSTKGQDSGVPCLDIPVLNSEDVTKMILESGKLPAPEQVLDDLGLDPSGPPVLPAVLYSVIHYPEQRVAPAAGEAFVLVGPEGAAGEDEKKDVESLLDSPIVAKVKIHDELGNPTRSHSRKEKPGGSWDAMRRRRSSARSRRSIQGLGLSTRSPDMDPNSLELASILGRPVRSSSYRWVVPAHGEVELKVYFSSKVLGQFDQTLHFEILGTNRLYQLHCRGTCLYPTISQDPRLVFPHWIKSKADEDIIFKQFVMDTGVFHFGPLLCGKSRARYKALEYPSNYETITILNTTPLEAEVQFSFQHDLKADTFLLDPPSMKLKPQEKQELCIWAYPTSAGLLEDKLVCCIQENPEPVTFQLCCQGVQVELGVNPKQLHFSKVLLHRRESRTLVLQNTNPLPMAWRLSGLENLGEDFSVSQAEGIIAACTEFEVHVYFKATKALSVKKMIRLEVSDEENILGIVQIENIQVLAEAYDIALNINMGKATDGSLDFGILKVLESAKQVLTLKNKGKYEISYSFKLEDPDTNIPDLESHFTVQPQKGALTASERPVQVQLLFHPQVEVNLKNKPILHCQVIEPNLGDGGETIAVIPIKVSAEAVFSKYNIYPASLNFGAMMMGTKKTCTFSLENKGVLDFQFFIYRADQDAPVLRRRSGHQLKATHSTENASVRKGSTSVKQSKNLVQKDTVTTQARISAGMFTVYPGFGSIPPGAQQVIVVDCYAEPLGTGKENLSIEINDRDPKDNPHGISYSLAAESCLPGFVFDDVESVFEEHRICSNTKVCQVLQPIQDKGVFLTEENKFIFTNVLVGHQATARFKIRNAGKIPCDVILSLKPPPSKPTSRVSDVFEVDPTRVCVPSHSHIFASVIFTPQSMQSYQCMFEASLDIRSPAVKAQSLTFEISGDGNLPRVTILHPDLCNRRGNPLLLFKKLLLGDAEQLPLVLHNSGLIPVQLMIDLLDEGGVFSLKARPTTHCIYEPGDMKGDSPREGRKPHTASLFLHHEESAEFDVLFKPILAQRVEGQIHLAVVDNPYEETIIQLVGEGYEDDFTLDNIRGLVADSKEDIEGSLEEDTVEAARVNHIQFGECHVGTPYTVTFTITNRSRAGAVRFQWGADTPFHFSPQVGHLHAGCAKDVRVTLQSEVAFTCRKQPVRCQVSQITFHLPPEQVPSWDDSLCSAKWVDVTRGPAATWPVKEKVMEVDPEPAHTVLESSSRDVELLLSAVVDYAHFSLDTDSIQFEQTLLFQTRTFTFKLCNTGNVALEYTWREAVEDDRAVSSTEGQIPSHLVGKALGLGGSIDSIPSSKNSSLNTLGSPFSVEPCSGTIPAGQEQQFQMKFCPVHVKDFESHMLCSIPNLEPDQKGPEVAVKGTSLMPRYHFELEDSDYITARRHSSGVQGPKGTTFDLNTRVVEFAATGVGGRNCRTFLVMNPTGSMYSFRWTCQDPEAPPGQVAFFCLTERGQLQPGKKAELKFEFIPRHLDITESFWVFRIPEQSISVPFLLVGTATDPLVALDRCHLNFQLLLIGHQVQQTIYMVNREKEAFSFAFRESSLFSEGCSSSVKLEPMEGSIAPTSRLPITVILTPTVEGEVVFNIKCDVKRKPQPLSLNIKATSYSLNMSVRCEDRNGHVTELSAQETNLIDFKEVQLNDISKHIFRISNNSKISFTFFWELRGPPARRQVLAVTPQTGTVQAEGEVETQLAFQPHRMCSLKGVELRLKISRGPTFTCVFQANVVLPTVHFSTTKLNFGACFIHTAGMPPAQQTLVITNKAEGYLSLNCLFTNTTYLKVNFSGCVLCPGESMEVPITFSPRELTSYRELIPFEINGLCEQTVEVRGKGTAMKVEVVEPPGKVVKLGAVSVGQTVKKMVTIANNSAAPLTFKLSLMSTVPELQEAGVLCLNPSSGLSLKPKGDTCKVEVTFSPRCRIQPFSEEVTLEHSGLVHSLFVVQGSCPAIHLSLDHEHLSFGTVGQQSATCQHNLGDVGAKFKWDVESFKPDFSISPTKGYISSGTDVSFVVTFHPTKLSPAIHYQGLQCFIQGSEPLRLSLVGSCMEAPVTKEVLTFTCDVREELSQVILLSNSSSEAWTMQPVIEGEYWKGPEFFHLEANQQNKPYKLTYKPLTMTTEKMHQGSIFFPLPDGTGLSYLLQGTAQTPKCSGTISREVPCRTSHTEFIPVSNWLNRAQRFLVIVDVIKPEDQGEGPLLQGQEHMEVPGSAKKDYKLTFLSYKEGTFQASVTFLNEETQEYLFYMMSFKVTASRPISTVEITTAVRQRASSSVKVDNPLPVPVTFNIDCKVPDVNAPPHFTVPPQSEADLVFEYQPVKKGESTGCLVLHSTNLGTYSYDLHLKATVSKPEKPLHFCTTLGSSQTITTQIINYARQKTDYVLQTSSDHFLTEKTLSAPPAGRGGSVLSVDVTYEPCQPGKTKATLQLSSPLGGDYLIPLSGLALPPKPQGPFAVKAGGSVTIPFKNVFLQTTPFLYALGDPAFSVRAPETLRAKKTTYMTVSFEGGETPLSTKLLVFSPAVPGVSWVYYLRGLPPQK
ncbi:PREDICTED: hydrocephalus-inducing protein homolog [Chaetura pelagica]|uniref:hydrocephalus-inducing protein homolog n=1 Tax=Chaetura pelagica TaxID=8897 RepID=UPI0005237217|nr:PREDICTED: hydrocephalus-inducing protein homolog [Chaetura pelagica]